MSTKLTNAEEYDAAIKGDKPVVILFGAVW